MSRNDDDPVVEETLEETLEAALEAGGVAAEPTVGDAAASPSVPGPEAEEPHGGGEAPMEVADAEEPHGGGEAPMEVADVEGPHGGGEAPPGVPGPTGDRDICDICQLPPREGPDGDSAWGQVLRAILPCLHMFHQVCIDETCRILTKPMGALACPTCRRTPQDIQAMEEKMISEGMARRTADGLPHRAKAAQAAWAARQLQIDTMFGATLPGVIFVMPLNLHRLMRASSAASGEALGGEEQRGAAPEDTAAEPAADPLAAPAPSNPQTLGRAPKRGLFPARPKPTRAPMVPDRPSFLEDRRVHRGDFGAEVEVMDKVTQLSTELGAWPTSEFSALDDESKKAFFGGIRGTKKRKEHRKWSAEGGEFLPLSAWSVKGFDTGRIESLSRPWDIQDHRVLGKTHRVPIYSAGTASKTGKLREDVKGNSGERRKVDGAPESESKESSSASSSSRSRRKKKGNELTKDKKGHKKGKKDKDARNVRKAGARGGGQKLETMRKKEGAKNLEDATAMSDKVRHMKHTLQDIVSDAAFQGMPQRVRETIEVDYKKISELHSDVKKVMDGGHNGTIRHIDNNVTVKSLLADMKREADAASQLIRQANPF
ncbi:unnamed protein product [Prorocentrum cordatum]|uniref:RING-type domain-containing protein n=1 Tax=Prorocentrum cordatum TaxID=2364126 RepID=A0ABN9WCU9_9DINO|nr:unnamed protein product [Polarella glacialis]